MNQPQTMRIKAQLPRAGWSDARVFRGRPLRPEREIALKHNEGDTQVGTVEVRDAIHGLVRFEPNEWDVLNSRPLQRLRGISQLAMTNLVYPGARHSRFEHSIGAGHVACRLAERLCRKEQLDEKGKARSRLAALVHDIGHGPFSHISEDVVKLPDDPLITSDKVHEEISAAILRHDKGLRRALGAKESDGIAELLVESGIGKNRSLVRDIVAGPADVDKFDYLLRDSHYCGVTYGQYDLDKVIDSAIGLTDAGGSILAFDADAIFAIEGLLLARHHMHRQVYGHKTRIATDIMLRRAMIHGVEEGLLPDDCFRPKKFNEEFVASFLSMDDSEVIGKLRKAPNDSTAGQLMRALMERKLMKRVLRVGTSELEAEFDAVSAGQMLTNEGEIGSDAIERIERTIADVVGVSPHWVSLYWENRKNPIASRFSISMVDSDIVLVDKNERKLFFNRESEIFTREETESLPFISLYIRSQDDKKISKSKIKQATKVFLDGLKEVEASVTSV